MNWCGMLIFVAARTSQTKMAKELLEKIETLKSKLPDLRDWL